MFTLKILVCHAVESHETLDVHFGLHIKYHLVQHNLSQNNDNDNNNDKIDLQ